MLVDGEMLEALQEQLLLAQERGQLGAPGGGGGGAAAGAAAAGAVVEELRGANPLVVLLRSLLPWVNVGQQPDYAEGSDHDGDAAEGPGL
jgi:hypothetical protein